MSDESEPKLYRPTYRARRAGQILIEAIGAPGPERVDETATRAVARIRGLEAEVEKLLAFKGYVHQRLDEADVPHEVPSPHTEAGCRIGGRLDWVLGRLAVANRYLE